MEDFLLFDEAIARYEKSGCKSGVSVIPPSEEVESTVHLRVEPQDTPGCVHTEVVTESGVVTCVNCGEEIERTITHDKEWVYYGHSDTRRTSDPNRVQMRKPEDRNIYKDVENMGFSDKIVAAANTIYCDTTNGQIFRGNTRKAIIFAAIFYAYKLDGKPQPHEKLIKIFLLTRKVALSGLKHVNLNASKESKIHGVQITPVHLIGDIMNRFSATLDQKKDVEKLYSRVKNKSSKLNRSRPQSVSAGLVYYYVCFKKMNITLKEFADRAELSELTISKIAKEIAEVLGTPDVVGSQRAIAWKSELPAVSNHVTLWNKSH
jgi:transcription initiation factor TFIIIB Brf1 subunit/transcription initiation factor TFIIB